MSGMSTLMALGSQCMIISRNNNASFGILFLCQCNQDSEFNASIKVLALSCYLLKLSASEIAL